MSKPPSTAAARLSFLDRYLRADGEQAAQLRKRFGGLSPAVIAGWAKSYYGQGLRALRRQLLPAQRRATR